MKSRLSKLSAGTVLLTACGALSSCALFGGGTYSAQTEIETEVPESLDKGKPSPGPTAVQTESYGTNSGVPASSNLAEIPEPWQPPVPAPAAPPASQNTKIQRGGPSLAGSPADGGRTMIDIPKPEFSNVSVLNPRPPAEKLSLGPHATPASVRMSLSGAGAGSGSSGVTTETVEAAIDTQSHFSGVATPQAPKSDSAGQGVPLLHGASKLSDFYQGLHQELFDRSVVANNVATPSVADTPADEALSVPPPPPAADAGTAPGTE